MLKFITKVLGKKTYRLYLNPDTNEYQKPSNLRNYVKSLGMTEQDWYNDRVLDKDQDGNPVIPVCRLRGCNNPCRFISLISGYSEFCSNNHSISFGKTLEGRIAKHGVEEGTRLHNEIRVKTGKARSLGGYIERYGPDLGAKKWNEYRTKMSNKVSLSGLISELGVKLGTDRYNELSRIRKESVSFEGLSKKYGEDKAKELLKEKRRKASYRLTLEGSIDLYGEEDGTRRYNEMVSRLRRLNYLDYYIDKYGEDDGIRKYNERIIKAVSKKDSSKVKKRISVSNESMTLFNSVYSLLYGIVDLSDIRYGSDRQVGEYAIYTRKLGDFLNVRFLDFSIPKYKLDIEFDGDYWHPTITEDDLIEFSTGVVKNISVYNHLIKDYLLRNLGWEVLHIKEHDYLENPSREINKCIDFIKSIVLYNEN